MKLSAPSKIAWIISLILGVVSLLGYFVVIPVVGAHIFWLMAIGWLVLILATLFKGV
jgi:hypothetical protein